MLDQTATLLSMVFSADCLLQTGVRASYRFAPYRAPALLLTGSETRAIQNQLNSLNPTAYQTFLTKMKVQILLRVFKTLTFDIR